MTYNKLDETRLTSELTYRNSCRIPTLNGDFNLHLFRETTNTGEIKEHLALIMGDVKNQINVLTRIHSECCTGDIFGCQRCDCQDQLNSALDMIRRRKRGALIYLRQEGRGIGLDAKLDAYKLQDQGLDTVEANLALGFEADSRTYNVAAEMIKFFDIKSISLISNNINKVNSLENYGINVSRRVAIVINSPSRDRGDLFKTKQKKLGHQFDALNDTLISEEEEEYPLSTPNLFIRNASIPELSRENTKLVKEKLLNVFGDNLSSILFQGSNMRGDGSIYESDFDYICILKNLSKRTVDLFSEVKQSLPRTNFLYLSENEYSMYPRDSRLQFFITRKVHGNFDLGMVPGKKDILDTAIKYAIQLKDSIRPLLFEFLVNPKDKSLLNQAHTILKRVDDCFMRVVCLYITGKYPLHREHLRTAANGLSIDQITKLIDGWYSGNITTREVCEGLRTADRLLNIFLLLVKQNKI